MNSGQTSERVYDALKQRILENAFRPGERLEPALLADILSSSPTPVREALNSLAGAGLLENRTGSGFHLALIDEPGLRDLYAWNSQVLTLAVKSWTARGDAPHGRGPIGQGADAIRTRFAQIARRSINAEHFVAVRGLSDRLHAARLVESQIVGDPASEIDAMTQAADGNDRRALQHLIAAFHRKRIGQAAAVVRALYRGN